ncbi:hypothetical protein Taro_049871 [Colocasia esculenta]|uniref:Transposase (putative) gypsy type domain-containing protein n=1 Tax=Colocasia esculenta TaxID=4460 RepID=A0A843XBX7_COLES|nr:hypothetical protein [Colocasia esculenta]
MSSSSSSSSRPRLHEGSPSGGSPSESFSSAAGAVSSRGTSHSSRPDGEPLDHSDDCFIVDPGTYIPKEPSSHTSRARRPADNVADAQCETSDETLAWMKTHPGLEFPEGYSMYRSSQLRAHYVAKGGVCIYAEAIRAGFRLPLPPFAILLLFKLGVAPSQLTPNSWRSVVGFLVVCALAKVLPTSRLFFYCFSVKAFGDWLYFAARPTGWPFPTTWTVVNVHQKAFRAPNLIETELTEFDSLQVLDPPDLFQLDGLFKLITKADKVMADKGKSSVAPDVGRGRGTSLADRAAQRFAGRGKKSAVRALKRPREEAGDSSRQTRWKAEKSQAAANQKVLEAASKTKEAEKRAKTAEKLLAEERLMVKRAEDEVARVTRAAEDLKETLHAKEELLKAARARSSRLAEEERDRIIAEYRDSEELKEEVDKLFEAGYDHCIKRIRELRHEYDLSGLEDAADEDAEDAPDQAEVADEAQAATAEAVLGADEATMAIAPDQATTAETLVIASDDIRPRLHTTSDVVSARGLIVEIVALMAVTGGSASRDVDGPAWAELPILRSDELSCGRLDAALLADCQTGGEVLANQPRLLNVGLSSEVVGYTRGPTCLETPITGGNYNMLVDNLTKKIT